MKMVLIYTIHKLSILKYNIFLRGANNLRQHISLPTLLYLCQALSFSHSLYLIVNVIFMDFAY